MWKKFSTTWRSFYAIASAGQCSLNSNHCTENKITFVFRFVSSIKPELKVRDERWNVFEKVQQKNFVGVGGCNERGRWRPGLCMYSTPYYEYNRNLCKTVFQARKEHTYGCETHAERKLALYSNRGVFDLYCSNTTYSLLFILQSFFFSLLMPRLYCCRYGVEVEYVMIVRCILLVPRRVCRLHSL